MKIKRFIALAAAALLAFPSALRTETLPSQTAIAADISSVTFNNFDSRINGGEPESLSAALISPVSSPLKKQA